MRRFTTPVAIAMMIILSAGCYHAVIDTGLPPSSDKISQPWSMSFIAGLIPPSIVQTASKCKNGVAKVETQHTILNWLVAAVTFSIVTPMDIEVTCASGGRADNDAAAPTLSGKEDATAAVTQAVELSRKTGHPVYVQF